MLVLMFVTKESVHIVLRMICITVMMTVPYKNPKRVNCHIMNLKKDCMMRILNKVCGKDVIRESDKLLFLFSMST